MDAESAANELVQEIFAMTKDVLDGTGDKIDEAVADGIESPDPGFDTVRGESVRRVEHKGTNVSSNERVALPAAMLRVVEVGQGSVVFEPLFPFLDGQLAPVQFPNDAETSGALVEY